ncbi:BamA/TamA family outer membrane protein, partial [Acidithiobacillus ferridurans]|nr:BamA/TamA family outer membrane protein [Acidithiobacillus ferridurans]
SAALRPLLPPPMGPLRLSLAVPLDKKPGDLTQPLQFTVGNNF